MTIVCQTAICVYVRCACGAAASKIPVCQLMQRITTSTSAMYPRLDVKDEGVFKVAMHSWQEMLVFLVVLWLIS
jgi:hypothetical protein